MSDTTPPVFSDISAQDTALAAQEAQEWIEAVTGRTFGSSFRKSLEDGVILCELMTKLCPDSIRRINRAKSPIAHLDNIQQFLFACKDLGLNDAQLFDKMDLQEAKGVKAKGVKRNEADRRIRSVCITLYWLGQAIADLDDYSGPQLDLDAFKRIMTGSSAPVQSSSNGMPSPKQDEQLNHYQLPVDNGLSPTKTTPPAPAQPQRLSENGLTSEQEQTADELLDDIQKTVDLMLLECQSSPIVSPEPPSPSPASAAAKPSVVEQKLPPLSKKVGMTISMFSINGGFGFRIVGGRDISADIIPQVDLVAPGLAADRAGLKEGDQIVSVNRHDVTSLKHEDLVGMIKQAGAEGSVTLGVIRTVEQERGDPPSYQMDEPDSAFVEKVEPNSMWEESREAWEAHQREQERRAQEIAFMYRRGPPPTVGSRPLPPLVEHQEESVLENIIELMESTPVPPPQSSSPSPPPSPPTLTISPPQLFSEKQNTQTTEIHDDRESIERELQELAMMEMTKPQEQSEEESSLASSDKPSVPTAESPLSAHTDKTEASDKMEPDREKESHARQPQAGQQNAPNIGLMEDRDLEAHLQELLELSEGVDKDIISTIPFVESPPPPLPQTEAPKRQIQKEASSQPATRPKPVRKAPSPPKPKPKKESILSQRTRLPNQTSSEVKQAASARTELGPVVKEEKISPKLEIAKAEPLQKEEDPAVKMAEPKEQTAKSPPSRKISFTPPPPPSSPPTSPTPPEPTVEDVEPLAHTTTTTSTATENRPEAMQTTASTAAELASSAAISEPTSTTSQVEEVPAITDYSSATFVPEPLSTPPTDSDEASSAPPGTPEVKPTSSASAPVTPAPLSKDVKSEGSYHKEEMRTLTSEDVEIIGGMKISRVQRTKWTPRGSLTEFVTSPTAPTKGPFQEQIQQHYSFRMAEDGSIEGGRHTPVETSHKPGGGRRADPYKQRYTQPEREGVPGNFDNHPSNRGFYQQQQGHDMQPMGADVREMRPPQWNNQEELQSRQQQQQHGVGYSPQQHAGSYSPQQHAGSYSPQQHTGGYSPQQHAGSYSPQQHAGSYQQQQPRQQTPPQAHHQPQYHHPQQQQQQRQAQTQYSPHQQQQQQQYPYRQQKSTPNGHTGHGGYKSASLPRNMHDSTRVNRSNTWSATERPSRDGPQSAFAVKAGNPYELCSRCHQMLGGGPVMAIPGAKTQYHLQCFVCRMCRNPLVGTVPKNTVVIMKSRHPHCHRCVSNKKDTVMTEC